MLVERRGSHFRVVVGGLTVAVVAGALVVLARSGGEHHAHPTTEGVAAPAAVAPPPTARTPGAAAKAPGTALLHRESAVSTRAIAALAPHGRVSRVHLGPGGRQADGSIVGRPSLSADGRYVAFSSLAANLVPGDRNDYPDVFVRDRLTRRTVLVSATPAGRAGAGTSSAPALSADGRWIAFDSWAPDLIAGPNRLPRGGTGVFLRDLHTGRTVLLSTPPAGRAAGDSAAPVIDTTGSRVAFESRAANLVPGDRNGHSDVFVWTRGGGLERVSRDGAGGDLPGGAAAPALSADGDRVAFVVAGTRGGGCEDVYVKDLPGGALALASVGEGCGRFADVAISGDGRHVAFSTTWPMMPADGDWAADVYVRDLRKGRTSWASRGRPEALPVVERGGSYAPSLSHDGRWIAFTSFAPDLLGLDPTREQDAYLRDRRTGTLARIAPAASPNGASYGAVLSPDGAHVAFGAAAENLVVGDNNHADDVFVVDRFGARYPADGARAAADRVAPDTVFDLGPLGTVRPGALRFVLRADEPGARFQCQLDGGAWFRCATEFRRRIGPGAHLLLARAIDAAGNVDRSAAGRVFTVRR